MERVATDICTFSRLREDGFTYVDKTEGLYAMASGETGAQFFIVRPRRFGKSLAVSTLKSLFEGRRDLFAGLAIEPKWDWSKKWPVLHLDMGTMQYDTVEELKKSLKEYFGAQAAEQGLAIDADNALLRSIGVNVNGEVRTNEGRIDMVAELPNDVYVVEFKLDRPAAEAMEHIKGRDYAGRYALSKKRVTLVGVSFSAEKRTIVEELVEELPSARP